MTNIKPATRHTWQRAAVRDLLEGGEEFRTAQQIHDRLRDEGARVGLATVYRALQSMADAGGADVIRTPEGEAAHRRGAPGPPPHLVGRRSGFSVEIEATFVESWAAQVAAQYGFTDTGHELELFGLCRECGQRSK